MTANRLTWALLILWAGALLPIHAQESIADHRRLDEIKARADKGDPDAELELAALYALGSGVPKDLAKAAKLHRKAAEQGNARGECFLGMDYANGWGVKPNMTEAVHWLSKAAGQGLAQAQYDLGTCYAGGEIQDRGMSDAAAWFRKAADQGLPQAQAALGGCYLEGSGVPKSIPEGIKWTRMAADQGNPGAQQALGLCYYHGKGVETNYVQAYKWLALAAAKDNQNVDDIKVNLSLVERMMTPEQIAQGQKLAAEFVPGKSEAHPAGKAAVPASASGAPASAGQARTGTVNVNADDPTQEIYADGAFMGNPPAKVKLAAGPHVIEVKKAGFKDYRRQVQVSEGSELTLRVVLDKQ